MRNYQRFVSRHRWVMPVAACLMGVVYALFMAGLDASPWWGLLFLLIAFICLCQSLSASTVLQLPAIKALNDACDPYPLLDETTIQLTYVKNAGERATLTVNQAAALIELGQADKALTLLSAITLADLPPLPPAWLAYNVNTATAALDTGDVARAQFLYEQSCSLPERVKEAKQRAAMADNLRLLSAELLLARGDAAAALPVVNAVTDAGLRTQVSKAWLYARIALTMDDRDTARQNLAYVLAHGNRLYVVQQARALMETL